MLMKRARARNERRVTIKDEPSTSSPDAKMETLIRTIEWMVDRISITERQPEVRNSNYIGQQQPHLRIKQREQQAPEQPPQQQKKIITPLQQNYAQGEEEDEDIIVDENLPLKANDLPVFFYQR